MSVSFDHVHLICKDPKAQAQWLIDHLGGEMGNNYEIMGAPQIHVAFGSSTIIVRACPSGRTPTSVGPGSIFS